MGIPKIVFISEVSSAGYWGLVAYRISFQDCNGKLLCSGVSYPQCNLQAVSIRHSILAAAQIFRTTIWRARGWDCEAVLVSVRGYGLGDIIVDEPGTQLWLGSVVMRIETPWSSVSGVQFSILFHSYTPFLLTLGLDSCRWRQREQSEDKESWFEEEHGSKGISFSVE